MILTAKVDKFPHNAIVNICNANFGRIVSFDHKWTAVDG